MWNDFGVFCMEQNKNIIKVCYFFCMCMMISIFSCRSDVVFANVSGSAVVSNSSIVAVDELDDEEKNKVESKVENENENSIEKADNVKNEREISADSTDSTDNADNTDNTDSTDSTDSENEVNAENENETLMSDDFFHSMKFFSMGIGCGLLFSVLIYIISLLIEMFFKLIR